jgi:Phage Mu protein F like protein
MAVLPTSLQELLDTMEPQIKAAFLEAIADINDETVIKALEEAIKTGNVEHALSVLNLDPVVFNGVADAVNDVYKTAAVLTAEAARATKDPGTGARIIFRFDVRSPPAEEWLRVESSKLVVGLSRTAKKTVRAALSDGMAEGQNPRTTALDIVGRVSAQSGRREGGIIGLTPSQYTYVQNARLELQSGDPAMLANYLTRQRRDKRFDVKVRRAIEAGEPLAPDDVTMMIGRYSDRLLQLRGENIARTETLISLHAGQAESISQMIKAGKVEERDVVKIWRTNRDGRERRSHFILHGKRVTFQEPFISPETGARMMHPGDRSMGALPQDVVNCRCHAEYKIDYVAAAVRKAKGMAA